MAIPRAKKTGTTIVGVIYDGGVVLGLCADLLVEETCGPTPVTGWRRIGKKLEGVAGPAVFLPCVAAAPRRVQTSTARDRALNGRLRTTTATCNARPA